MIQYLYDYYYKLNIYHPEKWMTSLSHIQFFATPWTVAYKAPPTRLFSRQEYWSGLPFPSPGDLPNPGVESRSLALQAEALPSELPGKPPSPYTVIMFFLWWEILRHHIENL